MTNQLFQDYLLTDAGAAIVGATVDLLDRNTTTPVRATTTTDANGLWTISHATEGRFDVRITNGSSVRWHKYDTQEQIDTLEVANFRVRNPADTFDYDIVPAAITADRQLNLPLITGTDTLASLGLAQTFTAAKTFSGGLTTTQVLASANDSGAIGASGTAFSDLFLASGAVINFAAGNQTITHAAGILTFGGEMHFGTSGNIVLAGITIQNDQTGGTDSVIRASTGTGTARIRVNPTTAGGAGQVEWYNGSTAALQYAIAYNDSAPYLSLFTTNSDGAGADADVWRVPDGQLSIDANTTWDANVFDYVCETCGKHSGDPFVCHGREAPWHDDAALIGKVLRRDETAFAQLEKLGVVRTYPDGQRFTSLSKVPWFIMSAMSQMYRRIRELEAEVAGLKV